MCKFSFCLRSVFDRVCEIGPLKTQGNLPSSTKTTSHSFALKCAESTPRLTAPKQAPDKLKHMLFIFRFPLLPILRDLRWFLAITILFSGVVNATKPKELTSMHHEMKSEKKIFEQAAAGNWKAVFFDEGTTDFHENWFLDGEIAAVRNLPDGMKLTAGPKAVNDAHHGVLWTKDSFSGDVKIEFEYTRTDFENICVNILFIQATGLGVGPYGKDIAEWNELRKVPAMRMYHDYMHTYHISFAAYSGPSDPGNDYVRARRYMPLGDDVPEGQGRGLRNTELQPDYSRTGLFAPGVPHHFTVIKRGQNLSMKVSNKKRTTYFHWENRHLPGIYEGRIGLRHMWGRSALYKNFRVSTLAKKRGQT